MASLGIGSSANTTLSRTAYDISASDDVDCDGFAEVPVGTPSFHEPRSAGDEEPGAGRYPVSMAHLAAADAADGSADRVIRLGQVAAEPRSWKLTSEGQHYGGTSVASGATSTATAVPTSSSVEMATEKGTTVAT